MTTDTLQNIFLTKSILSSIHVNLEVISEEKIYLLEKNWLNLYANDNNPQDVIVISGVNDKPYLTVRESEDLKIM